MNGWFKLHRELLDKAIWKDSKPEQKVVLITLLGMANHKPSQWHWKGKKFETKAGQFVTSLNSIAKKAGVSIQNVRTSLVKFEKYEFLTNESTKTGRLITVINWEQYQVHENELTKEPTKNQQRTNKELTPNKNVRSKEVNNNTLYMNDFSKLFQRIEQTFGFQSPANIQALNQYIDEGFEIAAVDEAINRTLKKADNPSFKYLKQILNAWSAKKIYLLKDIEMIDPFQKENELNKPNKQRRQEQQYNQQQRNGLSPQLPEEEVEAYIQELLEQERKSKQGIYAE